MTEKPNPQHANIFAALAAAQMDMGPALKQAVNPAFKIKYADLANVMDACLPALNAHGIAVIQPFAEIEGQRYIKTVFLHDSGQELETLVPLIVGKNDMQGLGSAMTYARRYGLMSMAGIAPEDDDGSSASAAAPKGKIGAEQAREIGELIALTKTDPATFSKAFGISTPEDMPLAEFDRAKGALLKKLKKIEDEALADMQTEAAE